VQVVPAEVLAAPEVAQVVQLEQWLMEGAYNKVWLLVGAVLWEWWWLAGRVTAEVARRGKVRTHAWHHMAREQTE